MLNEGIKFNHTIYVYPTSKLTNFLDFELNFLWFPTVYSKARKSRGVAHFIKNNTFNPKNAWD